MKNLRFDVTASSPAATIRVTAPNGATYVMDLMIDVDSVTWNGGYHVDGTYDIDVNAGISTRGRVESNDDVAKPRFAAASALSVPAKGARAEMIREIIAHIVSAQRLRHNLVTDVQAAKENGDKIACASEEEVALLGELGTRLAIDASVMRWFLPFVCGGDGSREPREWMSQGQLDALALGVAEGNRDVANEAEEARRKAAQ